MVPVCESPDPWPWPGKRLSTGGDPWASRSPGANGRTFGDDHHGSLEKGPVTDHRVASLVADVDDRRKVDGDPQCRQLACRSRTPSRTCLGVFVVASSRGAGESMPIAFSRETRPPPDRRTPSPESPADSPFTAPDVKIALSVQLPTKIPPIRSFARRSPLASAVSFTPTISICASLRRVLSFVDDRADASRPGGDDCRRGRRRRGLIRRRRRVHCSGSPDVVHPPTTRVADAEYRAENHGGPGVHAVESGTSDGGFNAMLTNRLADNRLVAGAIAAVVGILVGIVGIFAAAWIATSSSPATDANNFNPTDGLSPAASITDRAGAAGTPTDCRWASDPTRHRSDLRRVSSPRIRPVAGPDRCGHQARSDSQPVGLPLPALRTWDPDRPLWVRFRTRRTATSFHTAPSSPSAISCTSAVDHPAPVVGPTAHRRRRRHRETGPGAGDRLTWFTPAGRRDLRVEPRVLTTIGSISSETLPMMLAPWVVLGVVTGLSSTTTPLWRLGLRAAVPIALMGAGERGGHDRGNGRRRAVVGAGFTVTPIVDGGPASARGGHSALRSSARGGSSRLSCCRG